MSRRIDPVRQQMLLELTVIVQDKMAAYGEADYSVTSLTDDAEAEAMAVLTKPEYFRWLTRDALAPVINRNIPKHRGNEGLQPLLRGFEHIKLPPRIVIPPDGFEEIVDEAETDAFPWKPFQLCTLGELKRNRDMRRAAIRGSQEIVDLLQQVIDAAKAAGGQDDDVIADILKP